MDYILTDDFKSEVYSIISKYNNKPLNLMISGGSLLNILNDERYKSLNSSEWKIWFADERKQLNHLNYTGALPFLNLINPKSIYKFEVEKDSCVQDYTKILEKVDLCLLGIGNDGHICSLFPDLNDLDRPEFVIEVYNSQVVSPQRVTVTLNFLNQMTSEIYFVIPPSQDGKIKKFTKPHDRICKKLKKEYVSIVSNRFNSNI